MQHDPFEWIDRELCRLEGQQLRRRMVVRDGAQSAQLAIEGSPLLNFGSNDYLGLASDRGVVEAVAESTRQNGWGAGASPLVTGRGQRHAELESTLARFEGTEAALLFTSGYAANLGTIGALVDRGDAIFSDEKNHASIIDGCRVSGARIFVYRHGDVDHLQSRLQQPGPYRRRLIVSDGVFSMDGDLAPLPELAELADRYQAMLMVDEAHATGIFGNTGRGACQQLGVEPRVNVRVGTLSKALGSIGGFVAGDRRLIDWLSNRARSYVFSTALPDATCAAALRAVDVVRDQPFRRRELLSQALGLRQHLSQSGWCVGQSQSQIVPLQIGDPGRTMQISARLRLAGCFVPGIRPPSVPDGQSLLRISLCYGHDDDAIRRLKDALADCLDLRFP